MLAQAGNVRNCFVMAVLMTQSSSHRTSALAFDSVVNELSIIDLGIMGSPTSTFCWHSLRSLVVPRFGGLSAGVDRGPCCQIPVRTEY